MVSVALIASSFLPRRGGVEEHVANVAVALADRGHRVSIWAVDQGDDTHSDFRGIPVRFLSAPLPSRSLGGIGRYARRGGSAVHAWRQACREDRPDILNIQCFGPNGVYATALARRTATPLVYSAHGETFMDADRIFDKSRLLQSRLRDAIGSASRVTACSAYTARDLLRFGGDSRDIAVIPNGIDLTEPVGAAPPGLRSGEYVLGLGRLVAVKGFDRLIDAFADFCRDASAEMKLVIAGDGPERNALESRARELGIAERVVFTGTLGRSEVGGVMAHAWALVVPSEVEAFGITILEGWRAGIPVIAGDRGGPPEFISQGRDGLLVDPLSVPRITDALRQLLRDPERSARMAAEGRRAVRRFSWERAARSYEEIYEAVLSEAPALARRSRRSRPAEGDHR